MYTPEEMAVVRDIVAEYYDGDDIDEFILSTDVEEKEEFIEELELPTIKDFRDRGITYHPKRNYIPGYIKNEW